LYDEELGNVRLALTGDVMLSRALRSHTEAAYHRLRDVLRGADACFANLEGVVVDTRQAVPGVTQGTYMLTEPRLLEDLKWLGVSLVSCANNHAMDFGEAGVLSTVERLDDAGLPHAGAGIDLASAQAPAYQDTPAGRVALVAADASWREWHRAHPPHGTARGKPGVNTLRFQRVYEVEAVQLDGLRRVGAALGFDRRMERDRQWFFSDSEVGQATESTYSFLGETFHSGPEPAVRTTCHPGDLEANARSVREARRQADWVIVSLHYHEFGGRSAITGGTRADLSEPADFVGEFAHAMVDAGADAFVGHGPHRLLGAEIYRDRPIFYSLGNLVMQSDTTPYVPAHAYERFSLGPDATPADFHDRRTANDTKGPPVSPPYWRSLIPVCVFTGGRLTGIELHPVDLGFGRPRSQRGRPMLADLEVARAIIESFERLSAGRVHVNDHQGRYELTWR
jgi:poly-gamma-glutamate synthesis protein (capsule biosynthesis protein)